MVTIKAGHDFIEALRNVAIFASTDDTLPALCGVQMDWTTDGVVELVATDRYMLARQTVESAEVTADGPGHVFIPAAQVKQLSAVKMDAHTPILITVEDGGVATFAPPCGIRVTTGPTSDYSFPDWRKLWDRMAENLGQGEVNAVSAWNPKLLARFAKVRDGGKLPPHVKFTRCGFTRCGTGKDLAECGPVRVMAMQIRVAETS